MSPDGAVEQSEGNEGPDMLASGRVKPLASPREVGACADEPVRGQRGVVGRAIGLAESIAFGSGRGIARDGPDPVKLVSDPQAK